MDLLKEYEELMKPRQRPSSDLLRLEYDNGLAEYISCIRCYVEQHRERTGWSFYEQREIYGPIKTRIIIKTAEDVGNPQKVTKIEIRDVTYSVCLRSQGYCRNDNEMIVHEYIYDTCLT